MQFFTKLAQIQLMIVNYYKLHAFVFFGRHFIDRDASPEGLK